MSDERNHHGKPKPAGVIMPRYQVCGNYETWQTLGTSDGLGLKGWVLGFIELASCPGSNVWKQWKLNSFSNTGFLEMCEV